MKTADISLCMAHDESFRITSTTSRNRIKKVKIYSRQSKMFSTMKFLIIFAMFCTTSALLSSSPFTRYANSVQQKSSLVVVNQALGKADVAEILGQKTGLPKKDVELLLTAFAETVRAEVLVKGNEIRLREFGTFKQKKSAARLGRNPRTGEDLQILGSTSVAFSISSALKVKDGSPLEVVEKEEVKSKKESKEAEPK